MPAEETSEGGRPEEPDKPITDEVFDHSIFSFTVGRGKTSHESVDRDMLKPFFHNPMHYYPIHTME